MAGLAAGLVGCGPSPAPVVVLVSWDTTRADALGCYADVSHWGLDLPESRRPVPHTPRVDALAARGVRHQWALAHAPTTLASHASMMSGRDTRGARVPRNGFPVEPDIPLLAPRFTSAGWDTVAVVGASVLAKDMGLARGFEVYDDRVRQKVRRRYERPAHKVVARALQIVDQRGVFDRNTPLFLFVHMFDAHSPWDTAPDTIRARFDDPSYQGSVDGSGDSVDWLVKSTRKGTVGSADRARARALYLSEVSAMDDALGMLLDGLGERFTMDDSLVVLVGDHGEALDQPSIRPYGHGLDVDLVATHVPFVVAGTGRFADGLTEGQVVAEPVGLMDLAPTLSAIAGLSPDPTAQGVDLRTVWSGSAEPRWVLSEATKPADVEQAPDWNNVRKERAVVGQGLVVTHTPWADATQGGTGPHVFALAPGQPATAEAPTATLQSMLRALSTWDDEAPAFRDPHMTDETKEALRALGYLD